MRILSRHMPARLTPPDPPVSGWQAFLGHLFLHKLIALLIWQPGILAFLAPMVGLGAVVGYSERRRLKRLAEERRGEDIGTFARSFDCRGIDTWIIRAVYEELQVYYQGVGKVIPCRRTDRFAEDLAMDCEELDILARTIASRAGYSLESCEENPLWGKVTTVGNLVLFLAHQPFADGQDND